jgi:hypothetical protein
MRSFLTTISFLLVISIIYSAAAQTVTVSEADCARLTSHTPDSDVAYKPGVDVNGNAVAPADLNGGVNIAMPKEFTIPITVDLQKKLGLPADPNSYQTQNFSVGNVTVKEDGRAYFNGQPLQDDEAHRLSVLCQQQARATR